MVCCTLLGSSQAQTGRHNAETAQYLNLFNRLFKELDLNYVDTLQTQQAIETAINSMLESLDPFTNYYPAEKADEFHQMTTGKYAGIGSVISFHKGHDRCIISMPYAQMPAALAGLRRGDVILAINGTDMPPCGSRIQQKYSDSVSSQLRGEPGTTLRLRVQRYGEKEPLEFTLVRKTIALPSVPFSCMMNDSVGYIAIEKFQENTSLETKQALARLKGQGARYLMVDLRGNPGGLMMEAVKTLNLFLPRSTEVVCTKGKVKERNQTFRTTDIPTDTDIPIVVLVDYGTASAGEIMAGALQDYDRAVIVGQRTYGKGLVQEPRELPNGAIVKLTTCKYYIPSGRCVQAYEFRDGEPQHLPDSLSRQFFTKAGRPVRDCGGITPDIEVTVDTLPNLIAYLESSDQVSDFVARYHSQHPEIAPAKDFRLTQEEYDTFTDFLKESNFTYDRQSSHALNLLRHLAEREGYAEQAKEDFEALEQKLTHNADHDYRHWEPEIRQVIELAILTDYYYQEGSYLHNLRVSKEVKEGLDILTHQEIYQSILTPSGHTHAKHKR